MAVFKLNDLSEEERKKYYNNLQNKINDDRESEIQKAININQASTSQNNQQVSNLPNQQNNSSVWDKMQWVMKKYVNSAQTSVTNTIGSVPQSMAVGYNRAEKQAEKEQNVLDRINNISKNAIKTMATDPASRFLYNLTLGRDEYLDRLKEQATQVNNNFNEAKGVFNKAGAVIGGITSNVLTENNPAVQQSYNTAQLNGSVYGEDYSKKQKEKMLELDENINKDAEKWSEELEKEGENYGKVTKLLGNASGSIGYMTPSILLTALTGGGSGAQSIGMAQMGLSAKGQATRQGLKEGLDIESADRKGIASGSAEVGSEFMFNGLKAFKTFKNNGVEDFARNWIEKTVKNKIKSELGQKVTKGVGNWLVDVTGESIEELTTDIYNTWLDRATTNPNKEYTLEDATNTVLSTVISTTGLNAGNSVINNTLGSKIGDNINKRVEEVKKENANQQESTQNEQILLTQENALNQNVISDKKQVNAPIDIQKHLDNEINTAIQNKTSKGKVTLGKVTDKIVNKVKSLLGIDVTNRTHVLTDNDIRHMLNEHGDTKVESRKGQIAITEKDISKIPDIINNYDDIVKGNPNKNGDTIRYIKNFEDGTTYLVEVVPETSKTLNIKTMWKKPTSLANHQEPSLTSKTQSRSISSTSTNSIPQNNNSVKNDTINNNYAQGNENNAQNEEYQATKGETINWTDYEKPNGKIRKHYRSIIESSNTTAEAKAIAKELMGTDTYVPESNKNLINKADARINNTTPEVELNSLMSRVTNNEKVSDVDIAVGERLIEYYSKIGDKEHLTDAIHTTALAGTQAGRTVQAMALLNHMTPQGQVVWLERNINKANIELQQKFKNKKDIPQFELTSEMTDKILNTETKEEMYKALDDVYEELGEQVPKSKLEKIDEWRYFSMLANIKTHGRNMIGNFAMHWTQRAKNKVAGAIEGAVAKFNPDMERTHTVVPNFLLSKEVKQFAKNDVENIDVQTQLGMNENKYNPQSRLQNARKTFKNDTLNKTLGKMFDINSNLLEAEDNIGLKSMYAKALGEYITANKIDINNITDEQLAKARQHAIKEAKEATFHQESALATALNQMGRKNNIAKFSLDATVPFKKTPINVAKAGGRYSPPGLMFSAVYDTVQLRKGNITINQYIDNISKGLTGTGIAFMGFALTEAGILKASGGDDDKKEKYDEEQGKQTYSIEIGGKTYSLDWLSPVGIPLFIGSEFNQLLHENKKEKSSKSNDEEEFYNQAIKRLANIFNASANAMNPMSEMSMLSGITSVLSSYNKENAVGDMLVNTGKSYVNQFVPTALGQLARTTDKYERTTKSTKTGSVEKAVDSTFNQIKSKIPGLRQTLPVKTDIWGKEVKQSENLPFRAFNNFVNPSIIKDVSTDKVDKELNDLYAKTGESSIIPKSIEDTYTIDGTKYRMTNDEYAKYNKKYGQTSYNLIKDFINSNDYKGLTNEQKQKAIENIYSYAKESNKIDYANSNKLDVEKSTLYKTMNSLKQQGGKQSSYINYLASTTGMKKEKDKNKVLLDSNYDNKTKSIIYLNETGNDDKLYNNIQNSNMNINEYLDYKIKDSEKVFSAEKDSNGKEITSSKEKVYNYVNNNITGYNNKLLLLGQKYKLTSAEQKALASYITKITNSTEERNQLFEYYSKNFTVKDGKVYYK